VGDRIVPSLAFGAGSRPGAAVPDPLPARSHAGGAIDGDHRLPRRRELDLRRTEAPGVGALSVRRTPQPRRVAVRTFDEKGRIGDRDLFGSLGWRPGTPVSIRAHGSGALVVWGDEDGESVLTGRTMVAVPAAVLRWCGFGRPEQVLLVAVPSASALVIHGLETLDRVLPDPARLVSEVGRERSVYRRWSGGSGAVGADRRVEVAGG
jgi:hypothetical protein